LTVLETAGVRDGVISRDSRSNLRIELFWNRTNAHRLCEMFTVSYQHSDTLRTCISFFLKVFAVAPLNVFIFK